MIKIPEECQGGKKQIRVKRPKQISCPDGTE